MIEGIGLDIVEIERIGHILRRKPRFAARILTKEELKLFERAGDSRKIEFLAGRFAVKEAYSKANGTGIGKDLGFLNIEVLPDSTGRPCLRRPEGVRAHVSITHTKAYAAAQVIIEGE